MKTSTRLTGLSLVSTIAFLLIIVISPSAAFSAERRLVGIKVFSPIGVVLHTYGDPTFITSGTQLASITYGLGSPTLAAPDSAGNNAPSNSDAASTTTGADDPFDPSYDGGSRYYYDFPKKGLIYEFVSTSAGRVVEIKAYGYHSQFQTSLGVGLGSTYADVVLKYGYPEQTFNEVGTYGDILTLIYTERDHVAFRLVRGRVAVISVVAPD